MSRSSHQQQQFPDLNSVKTYGDLRIYIQELPEDDDIRVLIKALSEDCNLDQQEFINHVIEIYKKRNHHEGVSEEQEITSPLV